ncbi:MAG: hypothetical protein ABI588_01590 [Arenimonas sp.]
MQKQFRANNDALATARARLAELNGHAHAHANLQRETDSAGDAEQVRKQSPGVRLCDPAQRHQPVGVRQAQHASTAATNKGKQAPLKDGEIAAAGAACADIIGPWTVQQTVQLYGKKAPGPQQRVEIASAHFPAKDGEPPHYEVFGPTKASAPNGPLLRCTRTGYQLSCQRRVQQQACPAAKYVWASLELTIAPDLRSISGELRQTWLMDPRSDSSGCTLVQGEGQGTIGFRFVPAKP